jgi:hypothetical protein
MHVRTQLGQATVGGDEVVLEAAGMGEVKRMRAMPSIACTRSISWTKRR